MQGLSCTYIYFPEGLYSQKIKTLKTSKLKTRNIYILYHMHNDATEINTLCNIKIIGNIFDCRYRVYIKFEKLYQGFRKLRNIFLAN